MRVDRERNECVVGLEDEMEEKKEEEKERRGKREKEKRIKKDDTKERIDGGEKRERKSLFCGAWNVMGEEKEKERK